MQFLLLFILLLYSVTFKNSFSFKSIFWQICVANKTLIFSSSRFSFTNFSSFSVNLSFLIIELSLNINLKLVKMKKFTYDILKFLFLVLYDFFFYGLFHK